MYKFKMDKLYIIYSAASNSCNFITVCSYSYKNIIRRVCNNNVCPYEQARAHGMSSMFIRVFCGKDAGESLITCKTALPSGSRTYFGMTLTLNQIFRTTHQQLSDDISYKVVCYHSLYCFVISLYTLCYFKNYSNLKLSPYIYDWDTMYKIDYFWNHYNYIHYNTY